MCIFLIVSFIAIILDCSLCSFVLTSYNSFLFLASFQEDAYRLALLRDRAPAKLTLTASKLSSESLLVRHAHLSLKQSVCLENGELIAIFENCERCPASRSGSKQCICAPLITLCDECFLWHILTQEARFDIKFESIAAVLTFRYVQR